MSMVCKRIFDFVSSFILLFLLSWLIFITALMAGIDTKSNCFFIQKRIGQYGKPFKIYKLKTMHPVTRNISPVGNFLRKSKLDELPQLLNVLLGEMSFVGPRPDISGYYDMLQGEEREVLLLKPGITCPASIKYRNEEQILGNMENSLQYNDTVIFPDKVKMNLHYYYNRSFLGDLKIILQTFTQIK